MSRSRVLEQRPDLILQERAHRVGVAQLGAEILGEHLGVPRLVHGLCGRVVLGVDPRHGLDDLRRRHHGPLLAVHELRQVRLEELDAELEVLLLGPGGQRRAGQRAGDPGDGEQRAVLLGHEPLRIDVRRPVEVGDAVPLRPHGLVVEGDELAAVPLVVPQEQPLRVVVDDLDGRLHVTPARYPRCHRRGPGHRRCRLGHGPRLLPPPAHVGVGSRLGHEVGHDPAQLGRVPAVTLVGAGPGHPALGHAEVVALDVEDAARDAR